MWTAFLATWPNGFVSGQRSDDANYLADSLYDPPMKAPKWPRLRIGSIDSLLGIFITGPLGFILGGVGGAMYWLIHRDRTGAQTDGPPNNIGGDRERWVVSRRGRWEKVCARGAHR